MKDDIGDLLKTWPFDPDEFIARRITARDGTDKIQIRIDMGVLQLEVEELITEVLVEMEED